MDIQNGAMFLINCFLAMGGVLIVAGAAIIINNLVAKYWKPIKVIQYQYVQKAADE